MTSVSNNKIIVVRQRYGTETTDHKSMLDLAIWAMERAVWEETTDQQSAEKLIGRLQLGLHEVAHNWKEEHP